MPHTGGENYKAKWLKAINEEGGAETERNIDRIKNRDAVIGAQASASLSIHQAGNALREAASKASSVIKTMDTYKKIGRLTFAETSSQIDLRLSHMDMTVMARRLRDALMLAEMRIGILSEAYNDSTTALIKLEEKDEAVSRQLEALNSSYMTNLAIGINPTDEEVARYISTHGKAGFKRFNMEYEGLEENWDDNIFVRKEIGQGINRPSSAGSSVSSDSESENVGKVSAPIARRSPPRIGARNGSSSNALDI
jgi:hypothetical protein